MLQRTFVVTKPKAMEEANILYSSILKKIDSPIFSDHYKKEIIVTLSEEINGVVFHTLMRAHGVYSEATCEVYLDLYDVNGHKMKSNKPNIANQVERKLIKMFNYENR